MDNYNSCNTIWQYWYVGQLVWRRDSFRPRSGNALRWGLENRCNGGIVLLFAIVFYEIPLTFENGVVSLEAINLGERSTWFVNNRRGPFLVPCLSIHRIVLQVRILLLHYSLDAYKYIYISPKNISLPLYFKEIGEQCSQIIFADERHWEIS